MWSNRERFAGMRQIFRRAHDGPVLEFKVGDLLEFFDDSGEIADDERVIAMAFRSGSFTFILQTSPSRFAVTRQVVGEISMHIQ